MQRVIEINKNTQEYWNAVYEMEIRKGIRREDFTRFGEVLKELKAGDSILDIGCGKGEFFEFLLNRGMHFTGIDIGKSGIQYDREKFPEGIFVLYDGKKLPFDDNSFDKVVSMEVLEHVDDLENFISEAKRVCKVGGKVIGTTPHKNKVESAEHVWSFDLDEIKKFFSEDSYIFGSQICFIWTKK